jgi:hypothetical protein
VGSGKQQIITNEHSRSALSRFSSPLNVRFPPLNPGVATLLATWPDVWRYELTQDLVGLDPGNIKLVGLGRVELPTHGLGIDWLF